MAYRQYIGARYVPLFDGAWDATKNYEPLTVVEDGNGNSYTSKRDVPAGTPLNNREYWMLTATFSGAVEQLRRDLNSAEDDIASLDGRVTAAEGNIADLYNKIDDEGEVLTISDSYGTIANAQGKTATDLFAEICGVTARNYARGGASFKAGTLLEGLQSFTTPDDSKIATIIIFCGANDAWGTQDAIISGITDLVTYCKNRFAKAKKMILCCCGLTMSSLNGSAKERQKVVASYVRGAYLNGIMYLQNSEYLFHNTALLEEDKVHPTVAAGLPLLADMLVAAYRGDTMDVHQDTTAVLSTPSSAPSGLALLNGSMRMTMDNGIVRLRADAPIYGLICFNSTAFLTFQQGVLYDIANLSHTMVDGLNDDYSTFFQINGIFLFRDGSKSAGSLICTIVDQTLKAFIIADYQGRAIQNVTAFSSTDIEITLPANRY